MRHSPRAERHRGRGALSHKPGLHGDGSLPGAGWAGWGVGRAIAGFFDLDKKIGNAAASLIGFGDVAGQTAAAKADILAKASATVGKKIFDINEAMDINARAAKNMTDAWSDMGDLAARKNAPQMFADQMYAWEQEINKVKGAGVLGDLQKQIESHIGSTKDLANAYRISEGAVDMFKRQLSDEATASRATTAEHEKIAAKLTEIERGYFGVSNSVKTLGFIYAPIAADVVKQTNDIYNAVKKVEGAENDKVANSFKNLETWNKAQAKANEIQMKDTMTSLDETERLWTEYYDRVDASTLNSTDYKKLKVQEWFDQEVLKLKEDDENWSNHYDALYAVTQQKMDEISKENDPYFKHVKDLLNDIEGGPGGWTDTFAKTLADTRDFKAAAKSVWDEIGTQIKGVFAAVLSDLLKEFFAPLAAKISGILTSLLGTGGKGGLLGLLAGLFGGGGDPSGTTPITDGYFDGDGNWVPVPVTNGPGGGTPGGPEPPDVDNPNEPHESSGGVIGYYARGGVINAGAQYMARGGNVRGFPGQPRGIDNVPVWAAVGEGFVNRGGMRRIGRSGLDAINSGSGGLGMTVTIGDINVGESLSPSEAGARIGKIIEREMRKQGKRIA